MSSSLSAVQVTLCRQWGQSLKNASYRGNSLSPYLQKGDRVTPLKKQIRNQLNPDLATTTLALPITLTLCVRALDSDIPPAQRL